MHVNARKKGRQETCCVLSLNLVKMEVLAVEGDITKVEGEIKTVEENIMKVEEEIKGVEREIEDMEVKRDGGSTFA